ncbi:MAG: DUF2613 family protein [Rhodococcus sp. (in: high G+C Gram-positive bacteria)]
MKSVAVPAAASLLVGGLLSLAVVVGVTMSAEQNVRPDTAAGADVPVVVQNDIQYGSR